MLVPFGGIRKALPIGSRRRRNKKAMDQIESPPDLSTRLDAARRRELGQFFTPLPVAKVMAAWVLEGEPKIVIDPAFGMGVFAEAIEELAHDKPFLGFEVDEEIVEQYRRSGGRAILHQADYTAVWSRASYPAIIANPPYMRLSRFRERREAIKLFEKRIGLKLPGSINVASLFLLKSLYELAPGGRLAYIVPHEFMGTGYGQVVKRWLLENGLRRIVVVKDEASVFAEAITSICVVFVEKSEKQNGEVDLCEADSLEAFVEDGYTRVVKVRPKPEENWLRYLEDGHEQPEDYVPLQLYGEFQRGIATGDNGFFTLTAEQVKAMGLSDAVEPCITRACHVTEPVFTEAAIASLALKGERCFLLQAEGREDIPEVAEYLSRGAENGTRHRYLVKRRGTWYDLDKRPSPSLFLSVFTKQDFKVVLNLAGCRSLSCFHGFYPNDLGQAYLLRLFLFLASPRGQLALRGCRRDYGRALQKIEPGDTRALPIPPPERLAAITEGEAVAETERLVNGKGLSLKFLKRYGFEGVR